MEKLHHQMRLAEGGCRERWCRRRGDRGVEEIDVEADVQHPGFGADPVEEFAQGGDEPALFVTRMSLTAMSRSCIAACSAGSTERMPNMQIRCAGTASGKGGKASNPSRPAI